MYQYGIMLVKPVFIGHDVTLDLKLISADEVTKIIIEF